MVQAKLSKRKKSRPPPGDLLFFGSPCWARPTLASLVATSDLAALRLAKSRVFSCSLDASILQAKTKNVANHDAWMIQAKLSKRKKSRPPPGDLLFFGSPQQFRTFELHVHLHYGVIKRERFIHFSQVS